MINKDKKIVFPCYVTEKVGVNALDMERLCVLNRLKKADVLKVSDVCFEWFVRNN